MRELSVVELSMVGGGGVLDNIASTASKYGEAALAGAVLSQAHKITISKAMTVSRGSVAGVGTYMAWEAGQGVGNWLNRNTLIQEWIGKGVDKVTGLDKIGRSNRNR